MWHTKNQSKHGIKMSLQREILVMFVVLLLFFCSTFFIASSIFNKRAEDDFKKRTSETAINNVISTISVNLSNYNTISRSIMMNDKVVSYLKSNDLSRKMINESERAIYSIQSLYGYIDSVYIFRNDGNYIYTGAAKYIIDPDSTAKSAILDARGSIVVSINGNGIVRRNSTKSMITLSRAIYDINSQSLIGILTMNVLSNVFDEALELQDSGGMCITDTNGNIVCGNQQIAELFDKDFNNNDIVHKTIDMAGEKKILSGRQAIQPLIVICASGKGARPLPQDTIYALLLALIVFVFSGLICAWFITVNITRPISNLSAAMERTKSSEWLKKIDKKMPNNEIGRLAESYNSMIEYLNELFNRLLENEKNMQKAEMRVLQEQIKPHFLYNSLETISYLAVQENAGKAHDALETLGSFYRNCLSKGSREIPLKRELRITQDYLSLQKLRYGEIFEDEYLIDDTTLDCMIPKLILQPLVENCIYHGVRLKGEKCVIRITTFMKEDGLHIIIYDSGVGMSNEMVHNVLEATKKEEQNADNTLFGFGLRGTINRIRYFCGSDNVVQIRSELGEYTEIEICISNKMENKEEGEV